MNDDYSGTVDPALDHLWNVRDICSRCGKSRDAATAFNWSCQPQTSATSRDVRPAHDLAKEIEATLGDRPLTARDIVRRLAARGKTYSRTEINSALYRGGRWERVDGTPPGWVLRNDDGASNNVPIDGSGESTSSGTDTDEDSESSAGLRLYDWQEAAYAAWRYANRRGVVEAVTGTGKTRLGIAVAIGHLRQRGKVLVLVPSVMLMNQWQKEFLALLPDCRIGRYFGGAKASFATNDIIVAVVNSVRDATLSLDGRPGLLIADECHRYGSSQNGLALSEVYESRLGLSATYGRSDDGTAQILDPYFGSVVYRIGYQAALAERIITPFVVALWGVPLTGTESQAYDRAAERASRTRTKLVRHYQVAPEPFGLFIREVNRLAGDSSSHWDAQRTARQYLQAFTEQRTIVAETEAKFHAVISLRATIARANRTLVFTETIQAAEKVAEVLRDVGALAIHSEHNASTREATLRAFESGRIRVLVAPRILDEGIDVPAADLGIVVAASKTRRQMIQRMGRVVRRDSGKKIAKFVVLFAEGTTEDPDQGAHETYIEELVDTAKAVNVFRGASHGVADYLAGGWKRASSASLPSLQRNSAQTTVSFAE